MRNLALAALLLATSLWSDTLVTKAGDSYSGAFVSGASGRIRFKVSGGAVRSFRIAEIDHLQFGGAGSSTSGSGTSGMPASTPTEMRPTTPVEETVPPTRNPPAPPPPPLTVPEAGAGRTTALGDMGAINSEYTARGSDAGVLGPPRAPTQATRDGRAVVRFYMNGAIYWTSNGGAHAIYGPIFDAWMNVGGENSRVGYPTGDLHESGGGYSRSQTFERGTIMWTQDKGATIQQQ